MNPNLVVVPTYNERESLEPVVEAVLACPAPTDVLVVDDRSPDGTGELAAALARRHAQVHVLHRTHKQGLGPAYVAGLSWGLAQGYEVLCEMDADRSHDPADLPRLLAATTSADLVIGSRYVPGGRLENWPVHRRWLSEGGNRYVRWATGLPVADATSGYRAYRRAVLEELDLSTVRSDGYSFQLELLLRSWRAGFRVVEVPITFVERRTGASKISRAIVVEALWRVLVWGLQGPRGPGQPHPRSVAATGEGVAEAELE